MLPAVRAAPDLVISPPEAARAAVVRSGPTLSAPVDPSADDAALPISGGRLSALSLSAQLQLGQSFSVIADTIGKLLDLPRGENETLVDYSQRLSQAVQALPPSERIAIDRLLSQIVKGVPLRLLAELLKNPSGADAARLVALLEGHASANLDLAAKAAVRSYSQNSAGGLPASYNLPPAAPPAAQPTHPSAPPPAGSASSPIATPPLDQPSAPAPVVTSPPAVASTAGDATDQAPISRESISKGSEPLASERSPAQVSSPLSAADPVPSEDAGAKTRQLLSGQQASTAGLGPSAAAEHGLQAAPRPVAQPPQELDGLAQALAQENDPPATTTAPARPGPVSTAETGGASVQGKIEIYDALALVRLLQETVQQEQAQPGKLALPQPAEGVAALFDWLAKLFGEAEDAAHLPSANRPTPRAGETWPAEELPLNRASVEPERGRTVFVPPQAPVAADGALDPERPAAAHPASAGSVAKASDLIEGSLAAVALPLPAPLRDGIGWFQAPYPPAEDEPRREERKARAIVAITDEEDGSSSHDQGFHQERQKDEAADQNEDERAEGSEAGDEQGQAADFYWRLAGWA